MRFIILLLLTSLTLFVNHTAIAHDGVNNDEREKPYKATTVDECIEEKECVWYAFKKQLGLDDYAKWTVNGKALKKWDRPFSMRLTASGSVNASDSFSKVQENIFDPIHLYLPFNIRIGAAHTFFFAEKINETMREIKEDINTLSPQYKRSKSRYNEYNGINEGCYTTLMTEGNEIGFTRAVTVVDTKHKNAVYCTATDLYHVLGFWGHLKDQPFSFLSSPSEDPKLTKLDKFLVFLLYQPEFKSGQQGIQIKKVFDEIYAKTLIKFLNFKES